MRPLRLARCALLAATLVGQVACEKDNIVKLNKFNFDNNVKRGTWFVKFYAPWCTHCQRLAPIWEKLADQATSREWPVKIAEVDCTSSKEVCEKVQVKAFPMLVLISDGVVKGKYSGEASLPHFESWLGEKRVLEAGATPSGGEKLVSDEGPDTTSKPTATHGKAAHAVLSNLASNLLARFPTKSKAVNIYFYGGIVLTVLVACLSVGFRLAEAEDRAREAHEKEG